MRECPIMEKFNNQHIWRDIHKLVPECRKAKCWYVDSEHDSEYLPSGCVLLVAALLACAKEKRENKEKENEPQKH